MQRSDDAADAPLIGQTLNHDEHDEESSDSTESALRRPSLFIWTLTFTAGISGLLFGYE